MLEGYGDLARAGFDEEEGDFFVDGVALAPVEVGDFLFEAFDEFCVCDACFFFEFAYDGFFFGFVWFHIAFDEVPVSCLVVQQQVVDVDVSGVDHGAAGFFVEHCQGHLLLLFYLGVLLLKISAC